MKKNLLFTLILFNLTSFSLAMEKGKERKRVAEAPLKDTRDNRRKAKDAYANTTQSMPVFSSIATASSSNSQMHAQSHFVTLDPMTLFIEQFRRTTEGMSPQTLTNLHLIIQSEQLRRAQSSTEENEKKLKDFSLGIFQSWLGKVEKQLDCGCKIMAGSVHKDLDALVQESIFPEYKDKANSIFCILISLLKNNHCLLMPENILAANVSGHFDTRILSQKLNSNLGNEPLTQKCIRMLNAATQFNEQVTKINDEHDHRNLRLVLDLFTDEESEIAYLKGVTRFWLESPKLDCTCNCIIFSRDANIKDKIIQLLAERPKNAHSRLEKLLKYSLNTKRFFSQENNAQIDFEDIKKQLSCFRDINFERIEFLIDQYNEAVAKINKDHNHQFIEENKKSDYSFMYT